MALRATDFQYLREISIAENDGQGGYQMQLKLWAAGTEKDDPGAGEIGMPSYSNTGGDFRDIAFGSGSDPESATEYPYWVEETGSDGEYDYAMVWVKVTGMESGGTKTVYLFYESATAASASDGQATFLAFEDMAAAPSMTAYDTDNDGHKEVYVFDDLDLGDQRTHYRVLAGYTIDDYSEGYFSTGTGFFQGDSTARKATDSCWQDSADCDQVGRENSPGIRAYESTKTSGWEKNLPLHTRFRLRFERRGANIALYRDDQLVNASGDGDTTGMRRFSVALYGGGSAAGTVSYNPQEERVEIDNYRTDTYCGIWTYLHYVALLEEVSGTSPSWSGFGGEQPVGKEEEEEEEPAGLSSCQVTPARVVSRVFPAVAGLPRTEDLKIYVKALSGQETEETLEAIE